MMTRPYFATVARGLEEIAAQELESLGAIDINPTFTGVHFAGDQELLYRVNLWSRIIFRILVPISEIKSNNSEQLYKNIQKTDWRDYLSSKQTLAVHCTGTNQNLNHTHYTALSIKNAIIDQQREQSSKRSSVDINDPDLQINAHIENDRCLLSLDSSGGSLHRRGYHIAMGLAPLKETLAAALLEMSQWTPDLPFLDPLCGSGTLAIEATLKALDIAPGLDRNFGFQKWRDFDEQLWEKLINEAKQHRKTSLNAPIYGSDGDETVLEQARANAFSCQIEGHIQFSQKQLAELEAPHDHGVIICNPPYGKRIGNTQELGSLYKQLGDVFKQRFKGWTAYVLTGNKELSKQIGLRTSRRMAVYNGSLLCTLLKYELY